ncbi:hypothetical protein DFJ58DRAFT_749525 [Suillus subalutaceus]|uniref:uncharacterized protein n=1 Tax=Suillus subalutaceus TaxID=48586 RepID=UPI001B866A70|nr:uncharacterized protein DFJ58DRAFT_749525 [Suillus subalutaceus]KAG1837332.1 hypothetical protein DFJ58DRAFT_749525 [Suillus subalutaceus]
MPPIKTKETQSRENFLAGPLDSTYHPKPKTHRIVKLETQEATIPSLNSSVSYPAPVVNKPSISKPKSKAYYAIKPQKDKSPSPKAPDPCITLAARRELLVIWKSDPRVPTIASRHAWAVSRNVSPLRVNQWFGARKSRAKKLGQPISNDSYELSLEPRAVSVKRELLSPSPTCSDKTDINLRSDDTLVSSDAYGSDASYMSSRSSVAASSMTPELAQGNRYLLHEAQNSSSVSRTLTPKTNDAQDASYRKDLFSLAPSFSIYDDSSTDNIPDLLRKLCNQGDSDISDFTCTLCRPMEDYPEIALDKLVRKSVFPLDTSLTMLPAYARLDPDPDTPMELSAIPYLFCTPGLAFTPTHSGYLTSWMKEERTSCQLL